ncbi:MAG: hypothetical protein ACREOO_08355 [bacterium]
MLVDPLPFFREQVESKPHLLNTIAISPRRASSLLPRRIAKHFGKPSESSRKNSDRAARGAAAEFLNISHNCFFKGHLVGSTTCLGGRFHFWHAFGEGFLHEEAQGDAIQNGIAFCFARL